MNTLTREQIEQASCRELDALVAEHVIDRIVLRWPDPPPNEMTLGRCSEIPGRIYADGPVPAYSTSGDGMLLVLERMRELGFRIETSLWHKSAVASVYRFADEPFGMWLWTTSAPSLPAVTAKAALLAMLAPKEVA